MASFPTPSQMMRVKRPYLYSDSEKVDAYVLSESELGHQLETLTDRNQHKDFENFCRKLCEREISPNLRPSTGPEGGGDGKIDSDTYPVAEAIKERWFVGNEANDDKTLAFAFSTKKTWAAKIRSDVKGIHETGREYGRIICVTSRAARQKDRLALEKELKKSFGIPVTILDREWIVDRIFSHSHKDLAFKYLNAGLHHPDALRLGPNDFKRQQALDLLEDSLRKLGNEPSDLVQVASDSFEAARLSRELERPRYETEGRFGRAIKLADRYGTVSQQLRATYESAWTQFWWFDDALAMHERYEDVEKIAFPTDLAEHISKVCNLHQILAGRAAMGLEADVGLALPARTERLKAKLLKLSRDSKRPSNALHAETLLVFLNMGESLKDEDVDLDVTWKLLADIIDRSAGLGEFPAELLDTMISAISDFAPDSTAFDELIEKLAEFMAERQKDVTAGNLYLQQGERKLKVEKPIEAIKYLGRAAINYAKDESREEQAKTLYYLAVAYQAAHLMWAARATAFAALMQYFALTDREGELRIEAIPALNLIANIALQLGHIADFLDTIQFLRTFEQILPLDNDSKKRLREELQQFDQLLACLIVSKPADEIVRLNDLPDVFERLSLFTARLVLLYRLGYETLLRNDGSLPPETPLEELPGVMEMMAAQPATHSLPSKYVILDRKFSGVETKVVGVLISIQASDHDKGFLAAETYAAALEGFAATLLNTRVFPHTERLTVQILESSGSEHPLIDIDSEEAIIRVAVPEEWQLSDVSHMALFNQHLVKAIVMILDRIAVLPDSDTIIEILTTEHIFDRATLFCRTGLYRQRAFGNAVGSLSNLQHLIQRDYPPTASQPPRPRADALAFEEEQKPVAQSRFRDLDRHDEVVVRSIIDGRLWDAAKWSGMVFGHSLSHPPIIGLMFENATAAEAIFRGWLARFGSVDSDELIRIAVLRGIDEQNPHFYRALITHEISSSMEQSGSMIINTSRMTTMTAENSTNLDNFLESYRRWGRFTLTAAPFGASGKPEFRFDLEIAKEKLHVRDAWTVGEHDIDAMAIRLGDNVMIPKNEHDSPVKRLLDRRRKLSSKDV